MLRIAHFRRGAGQHRLGLLQVGGRIGGPADLAVVAVLVGAATVGADALDVAVGQEHALGRVVELGHRTPGDMAAGVQPRIQQLGDLAVGVRMGRVVVVEVHAEGGEVAFMPGLDAGDEGFRGDLGLLGGQHDRGAMGVVGAHVVHRVPAQAPRPYPDVGLDVADQVAQVQRTVGVGQGVGDQCGAGHGRACGRGAGIIAWGVGRTRSGTGGAGRAAAPECGPGRRWPTQKQRPGLGPGRDEAVLALRAYCRSQVCDLQMKAMQPDTSSFCPPSISAIFDL